MKIIINADDFGYTKSINEGIIEAYREGLISSTTIMINMPYAKEAIELYKQNENLGLGVHLNITVGPSILKEKSSLVDDNYIFSYKDLENDEFNYDDVYNEMKAQIEKAYSYDVKISHLDFHHSLYKNETVVDAYITLAKEYQLPARFIGEKMKQKMLVNGVKTTDLLSKDFFGEKAKAEIIIELVNNNKELTSIEIMCHVGYIDEETKSLSTYLYREQELAELRKLKEMGFYDELTLVNYNDL